MKTLHFMVFRTFFQTFLAALVFFVLILQLIDVFTYIWRYISLEIPFSQIAYVQLLYVPKCVAFSLSPSLLFAIAFTLGSFYASNELVAIFGSGISLYRLAVPLLAMGLILSLGGFLFEEWVVIDTFRQKNQLSQDLLKQRKSFSNTNVTVISNDNRYVYYAEYYNDSAKSLRGLILVERDELGTMVRRTDAELAVWKEDRWELQKARSFEWNSDHSFFEERKHDRLVREDINERPATFRKIVRDVEEMSLEEARLWIEGLRRAGLPYLELQTEYYRRFSFALTPLIVALISSAIGGRFKKNILLMSLLTSLIISVLYYVAQMMAVLMAKLGAITPFMGAWTAFVIFAAIALWLFRVSRT